MLNQAPGVNDKPRPRSRVQIMVYPSRGLKRRASAPVSANSTTEQNELKLYVHSRCLAGGFKPCTQVRAHCSDLLGATACD
eukprot:6182127-Pleurochrysis_carterae.AAC.3